MSFKRNILLWEIVGGFWISFFLLSIYFSGGGGFEDLALGTETVISKALDSSGRSIHMLHIDRGEFEEFINGWEARGKKNVILFFGNSQTHSINQKKQGEAIFVELLHKELKINNAEVLCISFPNAGLQEFYLAYQFIKKKIPIIKVVIPVFYDDLREDGIRDVFFKELVTSKFQLEGDSADIIIKKINGELRSYWGSNSNTKSASMENKDIAALKETFQERTELYFNRALDSSSSIWRNRPNVRGQFFVWLYKFRNTVFGIKANTVRKMIPQRYDWNMSSLKHLVENCIANNVRVLLYVPPIRSDVPIPYDSQGYQNFKSSLLDLARRNTNQIEYRDYESIIPGFLWGYKAATNLTSEREIDYMHFQFKGHQILADSLLKNLN